MTSTYTVEIQASTASGEVWQTVHPAETVDAPAWTAEDVARVTASNQTVVEGDNWRVCVWAGADTGADPAYVLHAADL